MRRRRRGTFEGRQRPAGLRRPLEGLEAFRPAPFVPLAHCVIFLGFAFRREQQPALRSGDRHGEHGEGTVTGRRAARAERGRVERHLAFLARPLAAAGGEVQRSPGQRRLFRRPKDLFRCRFRTARAAAGRRAPRGRRPSRPTAVPSPSRSHTVTTRVSGQARAISCALSKWPADALVLVVAHGRLEDPERASCGRKPEVGCDAFGPGPAAAERHQAWRPL